MQTHYWYESNFIDIRVILTVEKKELWRDNIAYNKLISKYIHKLKTQTFLKSKFKFEHLYCVC